MKWAAALVLCLCLGGMASAGYPGNCYTNSPSCGSCNSCNSCDSYDYQGNFTKIYFANVFYNAIDLNTRDIFIFNGAPAPVPQGISLGINAAGVEQIAPASYGGGAVASAVATNTTVARSGSVLRAILEEDAANDEGEGVFGYEEGAAVTKVFAPVESPKGDSRAQLLQAAHASLVQGGCAACHSAGKQAKGNVVLFKSNRKDLVSGLDWRSILAYTTAPATKGFCPPPPRSRLSDAQLDPIRKLAAMQASRRGASKALAMRRSMER